MSKRREKRFILCCGCTVNTTVPWKGMNYRYTQQIGWITNTLHWVNSFSKVHILSDSTWTITVINSTHQLDWAAGCPDIWSNVDGGGVVAKSGLTLAIPWTVTCQAPLSMGFSRQEYWSGLPFPSPQDLPDPGIEPRLQADSLLTELWGKPKHYPGCFCDGVFEWD